MPRKATRKTTAVRPTARRIRLRRTTRTRRVAIPRSSGPSTAQVTVTPQTKAVENAPQGSIGRSILSGGGSALGSLVGGIFGAPTIGATIGGGLGTSLANILGMGDYEIKQNSLINAGISEVPTMHGNGNFVRIKHREFIGDVISSATAGAWNINTFSVNPGMSGTFPWLAGLAQQFQKYQFLGLAFEFKSDSADALNSVNTALGSVNMAVSYRASQPAFVNKVEMLNCEGAQETKPSKDCVMFVECMPSSLPMETLYVRGAAVPTGDDIKTYDLGTLQVATVGLQGTTVDCGELWATYDIVLSSPIDLYSQGQYLSTAHYALGPNSAVDKLDPFGGPATSQLLVSEGDAIGLTISPLDVTFPRGTVGKFLVTYCVQGTAQVNVAPTITYTNCSAVAEFGQQSGTGPYPMLYAGTGGGGSAFFLIEHTIQIPDSTKTASFHYGGAGITIPTAPTIVDLVVTQISNTVF